MSGLGPCDMMFRMVILFAAAAMAIQNEPSGPVQWPKPSARQAEWHKLEYYAFVHFGPNTFTGREWGEGKENPNVFNPSELDCRQWVRTFKEAGMKQVVITAKHHDGFCLWPSKYSTHTVIQSSWKGGKGDVLKELRNACNEFGLKMGVYLSPWDRNHPAYGTPEYNLVFARMLEEVLTTYGPIYEVWFDGANGEGPNGKRQVYDWNLFIATVRKHAPKAVIFSDAGPDIRWVGNESGIAGETCWGTIDKSSPKAAIGAADQDYLNVGDPSGPDWIPAECDVSIRPGWFWRESENAKVKTPEKLLELFEKSVGRGAALLLNVPPDNRGLIHERDVQVLKAFKLLRSKWEAGGTRFRLHEGPSIAGGVQEKQSTTRSFRLESRQALDCDRLILSENIARNGQLVSSFRVGVPSGEGVKWIAKGSTIGRKRFVEFERIRTSRFIVECSNRRMGSFSIDATVFSAK